VLQAYQGQCSTPSKSKLAAAAAAAATAAAFEVQTHTALIIIRRRQSRPEFKKKATCHKTMPAAASQNKELNR
jgi:hypothetical protein